MKRTTLFIPEELERDLQLYARREGKPVAAVCREALAAYIVDQRGASKLPSFTAAFESGRTDTAERHEELLFKDLTPHAAPTSKSGRPRRRQKTDARRVR